MLRFHASLWALGLSLLIVAGAGADSGQPPVEKCRTDLAARLNVDVAQITVEKAEPVTWRDGSLGLARPGRMYTMALTPGFRLELKSPRGMYFYHTGRTATQYAGRAELWQASALYLEPIEDEPNLNGNLTQVSLLGTNPQVLLRGVSDFVPQRDGSILATRRTSRSGFDLVYLAPDARGDGKVVAGAFEFACPALGPDGKQYAVFYRPMLGMPWQVERGSLDGKPSALPDLPGAGRPFSLTWGEETGLVAVVRADDGLQRFRLVEKDGTESWEAAGTVPNGGTPGFSMLLNKSFTLNIETTSGDHPVTRVYQEHFLGEQTNIAVLDGFEMTQCEVTPKADFALLVGKRGDTRLAVTVDLYTGEVIETLPQSEGPVHLCARPSSWDPPLKGE